jgi:hypothetical protein
VHGALQNVSNPVPQAQPKYDPAVPVKKSVTPDAIISLIDGKRHKSLKRHLTGHGLTPAQYRERYGLPVDYPMVGVRVCSEALRTRESSGARSATPQDGTEDRRHVRDGHRQGSEEARAQEGGLIAALELFRRAAR